MRRSKYFVFIGGFLLWAPSFLGGCSDMLLMHPKGPVGDSERFVILTAFALMLIVVIPVFIMAFWFSRRYRAGNSKSAYMPRWDYSAKIDLVVWLVPVAIVTALAVLSWRQTHRLDPYQPIAAGEKPVRIEAVALDWKWLFIYPEQHIAAVNQLVFPVGVPLSLRITSDTVMASFFIPQLGSQIYAMAGRQSQLHLMADEPGTYAGHNQQFSGRGYPDMHFKAIAVSRNEFETWVHKARQSPQKLHPARYEALAKPSIDHAVTYFSGVATGLFDHIVRRYHPGRPGNPGVAAGGKNFSANANIGLLGGS